jgi:hypothetical protein
LELLLLLLLLGQGLGLLSKQWDVGCVGVHRGSGSSRKWRLLELGLLLLLLLLLLLRHRVIHS